MGGDKSLNIKTSYENNQVSNLAEKEMLVMATIEAPIWKAIERSSVDIVAVLDRSGSMQGERLAMVKETLYKVIESLDHPKDRFSLVTFEDNVSVDLPLLSSKDKSEMICKTVETIQTGGSTALCDGLVKGVEILKSRKKDSDEFNSVASVLLFTDGEANKGFQSKQDIIRAVTDPVFYSGKTPSNANNNSNTNTNTNTNSNNTNTNNSNNSNNSKTTIPCTINTFGYGKGTAPELLSEIASAFGGVYEFVSTKEEIDEIFAKCMAGILSTVAQNIKVTLTARGDVKISKIITTFPVKNIIAEKSFVIELGDLQSDEKRDILLKITVPSGFQSDLIDVKVEFDNMISSSSMIEESLFSIQRPEIIDGNQSFNMDIDIQHNRMNAVHAIEESTDLATENNFEKARNNLKDAIKKIQESRSASNPFIQAILRDMTKCLEKLDNNATYRESGSNYLHTFTGTHSNQRSCAPQSRAQKTETFDSYVYYSESSAKAASKVKFSSPSVFTSKK